MQELQTLYNTEKNAQKRKKVLSSGYSTCYFPNLNGSRTLIWDLIPGHIMRVSDLKPTNLIPT